MKGAQAVAHTLQQRSDEPMKIKFPPDVQDFINRLLVKATERRDSMRA